MYKSSEYFKWDYIPDCILIDIFQYLSAKELLKIGLTCKNWNRVCYDQLLWKRLLYEDFKINPSIRIRQDKSQWFLEYKRLSCEIPVYETEVITEHAGQVLHVSFSHDGSMFATCSKDAYILVWSSAHPVSVKYHFDMKYFSWQYTQFSQFNESDTLLMVSGVNFVTSGEIAVFSVQGDFIFQCRVGNKPYDMFGTWINDEYILSGGWRYLSHLVSASIIWLNKTQQETQSENIPIVKELFKFYNRNASTIRSLLVADTPYSYIIPNQESLEKQVKNRRKDSFSSNRPDNLIVMDNEISVKCPEQLSAATSKSDDINNTGKLLIFTTASKSYTPHEIGFKFVSDLSLPSESDLGTTLIERVRERQIEQEQQNANEEADIPELIDVAENFDNIDHIIDLHGSIIGIALSPDQRYLYVNSRPWPRNYVIVNPFQPPPIAQEIDIHVIDLKTFQEVGTMLRSHRAYTSGNECFFLFLNVSDYYVASGSEDKFGYIWDRHYGMCLGKLSHLDVVNAVAFNPRDAEMLVSASDDSTIKIWRSYKSAKNLNLDPSQMRNGKNKGKKNKQRFEKKKSTI